MILLTAGRRLLARAVALIALLAASLTLAAEQGTEAKYPNQLESMKAFLAANPGCEEFNDQCSFCKVVDGEAKCSTPQTACIKAAYICTARR